MMYKRRHDALEPDELSLRRLARAMRGLGIEVTEELICGLAAIVEAWPSRQAEPD